MKLKTRIFYLTLFLSAFMINSCSSQNRKFDKTTIISTVKDDSEVIMNSNEKCIEKLIKKSHYLNVYYDNPIVKNDSLFLSFNDSRVFEGKVILLPSGDMPYLLCKIDREILADTNDFYLNLFDYQIEGNFTTTNLQDKETLIIKPIINEDKILKSHLSITLKEVAIDALQNLELCNRIYTANGKN